MGKQVNLRRVDVVVGNASQRFRGLGKHEIIARIIYPKSPPGVLVSLNYLELWAFILAG